MARRVAAAAVLLLVLGRPLAPQARAPSPLPAPHPQRLSFVSAERTRAYYLLLPPTANDASPAPLLVLLHGSYASPLEVLTPWRDVAAEAGVILVAPQSLDSYGWRIHDDGPAFLRDLVEEVARQHAIDRRRVYLFGHSAGAVHALTLGMLESQYFAAVAVHAGAFTDPGSFRVLPLARRKIPLWIVAGERDRQMPPSAVRETAAALRAAGFPLTLTTLADHDHDYSGELAARIAADAWAFLAPLRLEEAPRYQPYR